MNCANQQWNVKQCLYTILYLCLFFSGTQIVYGQQISITQKKPGNIFYSTEQKTLVVHVPADSVEWNCYDYWNQELVSGKSALTADSATLTLNPGKLGWFKLMLRAKRNNQVLASRETSFAVLSEFDLSTVTESAFIGQIHATQSTGTLIPIAAKMGVKYIRDAIRWDAIENPKLAYNFTAKQDEFISLLGLHHLKPFMVLALYHPLYDNGLSPVSAEARLGFANYVKQLLSRYPSIGDVEVWNEPDIGTFSKGLSTEAQKTSFYFNLLKTTYEQAKPLFPGVKFSGFVVSDLAADSFLNLIYQKGALNFMNEYSFHSYITVPEDITLEIERHKRVMRLNNQGAILPMNLSETGFTTFTFTEAEQANYLPRRLVTALANGIRKIGIYNLQNKSILHDSEGDFGLIRHPDDPMGSYTPKPAYATYAALTRELTGANFEQQEQVSAGLVYSFKFKKGAAEIRAMYSPSGTGVHLYTDANTIEVVDMMGNTRTYPALNGKVSLMLDKNLVYVKGLLKAPYVEEFIPSPSGPVSLSYGFYRGGYQEFPDSAATVKWVASTGVMGLDGKRSRVVAKPLSGAKCVWKAAIAIPGTYKVSAYLPADSVFKANSTRNAQYHIYVSGVKVATKTADQFTNQGNWFDLGTYTFPRGDNNYVELQDASAAHDKPLRADVLKFDLIP